MSRSDHHDDLVLEERRADRRGVDVRGHRAEGDVDGTREQQRAELAWAADAQLDVQVVGPAGEQLDETWCRMFGEQARSGDAQEATTNAGLAHLEDRAILQPQHLGRSAGKAPVSYT